MVNRVILVGNLGRDAELRYTPGGAAVAKFSVATTEKWTDKQGQRQERVEWHSVDLWGKMAEALSEYLVKGKQVYVEGRIQSHEYTDKEGVKRRQYTIRADQIRLLGGGSGNGGGRRRDEAPADDDEDAGGSQAPLNDDDIPFAWLLPLTLAALPALHAALSLYA